jgi:branched-chain amino acid transport system ATP-binding protein
VARAAPHALGAARREHEPACELVGVSKSFGAVRAVADVSLTIAAGSLTCLIGPNGAGKSTLLGCISGFHPVQEGRVRVCGRDVTHWPPHRRARHGLATVFQTTRALEHLDVLDNVAVGSHVRSRAGFVECMLRLPWQWREERRVRHEAREALEIVGLVERASVPAAALPLGQLRLLAIARTLAQRPEVLLLDEPAAGLRAAEKARLIEALSALRRRGLTQVLVEHDMQFVGAIAERVIVLDRGQVIADGPPEEVRRDPTVVAAYLGSTSL